MRPLLFDPVLVRKPWGGRRLGDLGVHLPDDDQGYGEAWVVADLSPTVTPVEDPVSRITSGPGSGQGLADLIASDPDLLGDAKAVDGRFPLLVKLLDAHQHLSVQVHPTADVLIDHPYARLKAESWVVVAAEPDADLFLGLADGVDPGDVKRALGTPDLVPFLRRIPARVGDVFNVPAGLIHALGAGVVVAEVQTPSDTTWRLYDWTAEYDRAPRALHTDPGWQTIQGAWELNTTQPSPGSSAGRLVTTEHYTIDRHDLASGENLPHLDDRSAPRVVQVLDGRVDIDGHHIGRGQVAVLPARDDAGAPTALSDATVLVTVPGQGNRPT